MTVNCDDVASNFENDKGVLNEEQYKKNAEKDKVFALKEFGRGQYACYCD
jgi:hypothetical protein